MWVALVAPNRPWLLTPGAFVRLPLEGIVVVLLAVVLPTRARRVVPWVIGPALGLLVLVKLLDLGFFIAFDRPFNPVDDWSYASIGVETVRDTFGRAEADLAVAGAVLLGVAALVLPTLAVLRVTRVAARHRRHSLRVVAGAHRRLGGLLGDRRWSSARARASPPRAGPTWPSTRCTPCDPDLRDRARFSAEIRDDRYRTTPGERLLAGLRGKDVLLVFVESYGKMAVEGTSFSPGIDAVLDAGNRQLAAAGFSARSGWLTSAVFGGGSWMAHATLQSGAWVDSPGRYDELVSGDRLTLTKAFGRAGWRTVADLPSNNRAWPEGYSFYRFDKIYDRRNVGYRGPTYAFASMPDQYVLLALQRLELAKPHRRPVFAEIDLVSSHTPWTRIPRLIDWSRVGDGSIFNRLPVDQTGLADTQQGYARSIRYTLRALFSFVEHYGRKNLVLVVLGDHQPSRVVSGRPGHDVPISVIAHDPAVMRRIAGWGWVDGMRPGPSGAGLADERLPGPLPRRVRLASTSGSSSRRRRRATSRRKREVERVLAPTHLRLQVADVRGGDVHARPHLRDDGHAAGAELPGLVRVVAEEGDPRHPKRVQHLRGGHVAALVLAVAQREVRLVGVDPGVLQRVRLELRVEPDAAALLPQIEQVAAGVGDALDGLAQLRPAVAALAPEHVSGEALAVRADQRHGAASTCRDERPRDHPARRRGAPGRRRARRS